MEAEQSHPLMHKTHMLCFLWFINFVNRDTIVVKNNQIFIIFIMIRYLSVTCFSALTQHISDLFFRERVFTLLNIFKATALDSILIHLLPVRL